MNKKHASLLTISLLFCLASCGGGQSPASSSSESSSSSTQSVSSESSSQQSSSSEASSRSEETTSRSEESVSSESSSEEIPGESQLKKRIATLTGNIDELPDGDTMFLAKQEQKPLAMRDYSTPSAAYYETNPYYSFNSEIWERIDSLKDESIRIRDFVLAKAKQLNTWITDPDVLFSLDYDSLADEITIKYRRSLYYYEITSSYAPDGKIVLKTTRYTNEDFRFLVDSLSYVEGEKGILCSSIENIDPASYKRYTIIESDLANNKITEVERTIVNDVYQNSDYLHTILLQEENGIKCVSSRSKSGQLDINIYDEDGYSLGDFSYFGNDCNGAFSLYELEGWDSVIFDEQIPSLDVTINGTVHKDTEYFDDSFTGYFLLDSAGFDVFPTLTITSQGKVLDYSDFLDVIYKNYGLTPKHDYTETIEKMMKNIESETKNRTAFGFTDLTKMDLVTFNYLYDNYNLATLTREDVIALSSVSSVWIDDQEETDFEIGYLDGTITGEIAFDFPNMTMNPKDVAVTIPSSSLLSPNLTYQAKIVSNGTNGKKVLCESNTATLSGGLSFSFKDENIGLLDSNLAEDGRIEVIVGVVAEDGFRRISKNMPLPCSLENASYPLADIETVLEEDFIKYNVVVSRALKVVNGEDGLYVYIETSAVKKNYLDAKLEGKLGFDLENMTISPKDLSLTIEDTSFLNETTQYQAMLVATYSNGESKVICQGEYAQINNGLTLSFDPSNASLLEFVREEECVIEAVAYALTSNGKAQISKNVLVSSDVVGGAYALPDLETIVEEDSKQYKVTTHRNLVISNENGLKLRSEVTSTEKEEIVEEPLEEEVE